MAAQARLTKEERAALKAPLPEHYKSLSQAEIDVLWKTGSAVDRRKLGREGLLPSWLRMAPNRAGYALRDEEGKFVARARNKASAYRASRTKKHFGASVDRNRNLDRDVFNRAIASGAQAIYEAGRDAGYAKIGEHHGYTGLAHGVSAVLASRGVSAEPMELTGDFHSQLVGMADHADTATVQDIARHFDSQLHFSSTLPYEVENVGRFHAPYSYGGSIDTGWIASEIDKKLKADKIRRGTKKYHEFVEKNAERVVSAVRDAVRKRAERQAASQREWVEKHRGEVDKVERSVAHLDRTEEILVALTDAAGVEPKSIGKLRERRELFRRAADSMRSSLASALEPVEADEETVRFALQLPDLKPFAEAAGVLTGGEANRAIGGRLTAEERGEVRSKVARKLATSPAGFSLAPANDTVGMPGSVWVHREPDGAVVVRKIGGSQFVRIDEEGGAYSARVWYGPSGGAEARMGRMSARRSTIDAAVTWAKDLLTREEREAGTRQRMEAGREAETASGMVLPVGSVVRFRERGSRRRYVVAKVNRFGSGATSWTDYHLVALSGGEAGSGPSGVRREQLMLDADQGVVFEGAIARRLEHKYKQVGRM